MFQLHTDFKSASGHAENISVIGNKHINESAIQHEVSGHMDLIGGQLGRLHRGVAWVVPTLEPFLTPLQSVHWKSLAPPHLHSFGELLFRI